MHMNEEAKIKILEAFGFDTNATNDVFIAIAIAARV